MTGEINSIYLPDIFNEIMERMYNNAEVRTDGTYTIALDEAESIIFDCFRFDK